MDGGWLAVAVTRRLTEPECPIANRCVIQELTAVVRCLGKQATKTLRPSPVRGFAMASSASRPASALPCAFRASLARLFFADGFSSMFISGM